MTPIKLPPLRLPAAFRDSYSKRDMQDYGRATAELNCAGLAARVAELEAHLRTIATFGGTLDQARELATKGIERAALLDKES